MLEFIFVGALLPAYPMENLNIDETARPILLAHSAEYRNPYTCINIIDNYLPKLQASENLYLQTMGLIPNNGNVSADTNDELNNSFKTENKNLAHKIYKKTPYTYNHLLALITKHSCLITADKLDDAKKIEKIIEDFNLSQNRYPIANFVFNYNLNRQILLENNETSSIRFANLYSLGNANSRANTINKYYSMVQELNKHNVTQSYLESINLFNIISKSFEFQNLPVDLKVNILYNGFIITSLLNKPSLAISMLEEAINTSSSSKYTYLNAKLAKFTASIFAKNSFYSKAITLQEKYLHAIEDIPFEADKYLEGLVTLAEYYQANFNYDIAYTYLIKANNLLNARSIGANFYDLRLRIANLFLQSKNKRAAINVTKDTYEYFKDTGDNNYLFNSAILYMDALLKNRQTDKVSKLIPQINKLQKDAPDTLEANQRFYFAKARFYARKGDYKNAYRNLNYGLKIQKSVHEMIPQIMAEQDHYQKLAQREKAMQKDLVAQFLEKNSEIFSIMHYTLLIVILWLLLIIYRIYSKYKNVLREKENIEDNLRYQKPVDIASISDFLNKLRTLSEQFIYQEKIKTNLALIPTEKEIFHIYFPGLNNLSINIGDAHANFIYNIFKTRLKELFQKANAELYEVNIERYIVLSNIQADNTVKDTCEALFEKLQVILNELRINSRICIGVIEYPFIIKHPINQDTSKILELSLIALKGATNINPPQNTWLKLTFLSSNKDFISKGNIRQTVLDGIRKKHIRIISSNTETLIDWEKLLDTPS